MVFTWLDVHKFQDKHAIDIVEPKIDPWKEEQAQEHRANPTFARPLAVETHSRPLSPKPHVGQTNRR